jgi:ribosomal protein L14
LARRGSSFINGGQDGARTASAADVLPMMHYMKITRETTSEKEKASRMSETCWVHQKLIGTTGRSRRRPNGMHVGFQDSHAFLVEETSLRLGFGGG